MRASSLFVAVAVVATGLSGCSKRDNTVEGGGSTFAYPMMSRWAGQYEKKTGITVRYHAIGSGKGVDGMTDKMFDFGCTDGPMDSRELEKARMVGGDVVHIPLFFGAVVPAYNLPGISEPLRFNGAVLAEIFLGKITKWNDLSIRHLNPGVTLPDETIHVTHRLDSSGTTYIWTDYLSRACPEWKDRVGTGKSIQWPIGVGENGNLALAGSVKRTPGAIGYVELSTALESKVPFGSVENHDGVFVLASQETIAAAADSILKQMPEDLRFSFESVTGKTAYPITGATWAIAYVNQTGPKGKLLVDFLKWTVHDGQESFKGLGYAGLPQALQEKADTQLNRFVLAK